MIHSTVQWWGRLFHNNKVMLDLAQVQSDVLMEILLQVDTKTLIQCCTLVSKQWNGILAQKQFWVRKCEMEGYTLPLRTCNQLSINYKLLAHKKPFNRNFIADSWTENGKLSMDKRWRSHGFKVEAPPLFLGEAENFEEFPVVRCLVSSYTWCEKTIIIDLVAEGLEPIILDELRPTLVVSELIAHRSDCAAVYQMNCQLRKELETVEEEDSSCSFKTEVRMAQWQEQRWVKVEHEFKNYPKGIRFLILNIRGKDQQFWAGQYGSKMANCLVMAREEFSQRDGT